MPVHLNRCRFHTLDSKAINIGIINNMPDGALEATERQFTTLLALASGDLQVRVSFYRLPGIPRSESGRRYVEKFYLSSDDLLNERLDGLIVTGAEPKEVELMYEPYWDSMARIIEWAGCRTHSAIWSCLAAHAAVLHLDGIRRRRMAEKRVGVFESSPASGHMLTERLPSTIRIPHSRWNSLRTCDLAARGYRLLAHSDYDIDIFARQRGSLFVFFQGHPEYEADTLLFEYKRDVGRYLRGKENIYPSIPQNYFDCETAAALEELSRGSSRREVLPAGFPNGAAVRNEMVDAWRPAAVRIYSNWLEYMRSIKMGQVRKNLVISPAILGH